MPPKKEKKEQITGNQANDLILDYLRQQNRPYSAIGKLAPSLFGMDYMIVLTEVRIDISANIHNAVTKTNAAKILKELHEKGIIEGRASGKQVVYHTIQDPKDFASPEDLKTMDLEIESIKTQITTTKAELKELQSTLHTLKAAPTTTTLRKTVAVLEAETRGLEASLVPIRGSPLEQISASEKATMDAEFEKLERLLRGRKKQFKGFWDTICDGCGDMNPSDLWDRLGLEEDT